MEARYLATFDGDIHDLLATFNGPRPQIRGTDPRTNDVYISDVTVKLFNFKQLKKNVNSKRIHLTGSYQSY
jgi:hypothetical protein